VEFRNAGTLFTVDAANLDVSLKNITFRNVTFDGAVSHGGDSHGLYLGGSGDYRGDGGAVTDIVIEDSVIKNNGMTPDGDRSPRNHGIYLNKVGDITIRNTTFINNAVQDIKVRGVGNLTVESSLFDGGDGNPIAIAGDGRDTSGRVVVRDSEFQNYGGCDSWGACYAWGEATDGERTVTSRLKTPETYALTVDAATTAAGRVLDGEYRGFETPAAAFTPEFVLELDGVEGFDDA